MKQITRLRVIDVLRGIAFLAVVLQHVIAGIFYVPNIAPSSVIGGTTILAVVRFAVPAFVFISGLLLFFNYDKEIGYKQFIKKRFIQIIIPYVVWSAFYVVWLKFVFGFEARGVWNGTLSALTEIGQAIITGTGNYHLWFMSMLIPFYFVFPFFKLWFGRNRPVIWNLFVVVLFMVGNFFALVLLSKGALVQMLGNFYGIAHYLDRNPLLWTFYFVLGALAGVYYPKFMEINRKTALLSLLAWGGFIYFMYVDISEINSTLTPNNYSLSANVSAPLSPINYWFLILSILVVINFSSVIESKTEKLSKLLVVIGKYSFGGYLIHAFILHLILDVLVKYLNIVNIYLLMVSAFFVCVLVSILLTSLIGRVKLSFGEIVIGKV